MPAYHIEFKKSAQKEFEKLPSKIQGKIVDALAVLAVNPFSELLRVKKLKGAESLYRFHIRDYRILYEVQTAMVLIVVIKIGHRKDVYRDF